MSARRILVLVLTLATMAGAGCGDPPSRVGQVCQTDAHCGQEAGLDLVCDHRIPGGSCTVLDCVLGADDACPPGAFCARDADGSACRPACQSVLDCRSVIVCQPDPDCDPDQQDCSTLCENEMACVAADPQAAPADPEPELVCQLRAG